MTDTPTPGEAATLPVAWLRIDPFGNVVPASPEVDGAFPVYREARAAALPTIEAIMELAGRFADAAADYQEDSTGLTEGLLDIARETLRAALARALPVGEERDASCDQELAVMIRQLVSALRKARPCAPQDLDYRAINLLRKHGLLGSPLRDDPAMAPKGETP